MCFTIMKDLVRQLLEEAKLETNMENVVKLVKSKYLKIKLSEMNVKHKIPKGIESYISKRMTPEAEEAIQDFIRKSRKDIDEAYQSFGDYYVGMFFPENEIFLEMELEAIRERRGDSLDYLLADALNLLAE